MTGHKVDSWIANKWMGKTVRQTASCDGPMANDVGRVSKVVGTFFDETGALHVETEDGYFCPAGRLEIVDED